MARRHAGRQGSLTGAGVPRVRHARPADLPHIALLAAEHAAYEKAVPPPADLPQRLEKLLFGPAAPRLCCFVAELEEGEIIGYASCAPELSTWDGAEYLHVTPPRRERRGFSLCRLGVATDQPGP